MKITQNTKRVALPSGVEISISHYNMGDRYEYHARAYKGGELLAETYAQYINGYPGACSWVCSSRGEAFAKIKKWIERF